MNDRATSDVLSTLVVVALLILTAWGNAVALLIFGAAGVLLGLFFYRRQITGGAARVAMVALGLGVIIALLMLLR